LQLSDLHELWAKQALETTRWIGPDVPFFIFIFFEFLKGGALLMLRTMPNARVTRQMQRPGNEEGRAAA